MAIKVMSRAFGKALDGSDLILYTMSNERGVEASVMNLGAILVHLAVPNRDGRKEDIVLGFDKGEDYYTNPSFFGATIGPNANRIGGASFVIDGKRCELGVNDNENNLHSHFTKGYHARLWEAEVLSDGVKFSLEDTDGNMGFPGNKKIEVTYTLDEENGLKLQYRARSDKNTIFNLTNHSYFNLDGHDEGTIEQHRIWIKGSRYTPVRKGGIPTGEIAPVKGTPMDFTVEKVIGDDIDANMEQLRLTGGYDHNWVMDDWSGELQHIATARSEKSGRTMEVYSTLPGVQLYTGNFIAQQTGKGGVQYDKRHGFCLETQYFPDSVHHADFPSCVFGADRDFEAVTVFRFV